MTIPDPLGDAARWIGGGGLLAYPTETVWGLGADAGSREALARLRRWKARESVVPLAVLVEGVEAAERQGFDLSGPAQSLAEAFWPGPLTLVVPSRRSLLPGVARRDGAVGLRCSAHPLAQALARRLAREGVGPVTATSLNRTGTPPARTLAEARAACDGSADAPRLLAVEGAEAGGDAESTVVDLTESPPRVLRWGAIDAEVLTPLLEGLGAR
jgi:L-threonylcarbamoyladenylate synthase